MGSVHPFRRRSSRSTPSDGGQGVDPASAAPPGRAARLTRRRRPDPLASLAGLGRLGPRAGLSGRGGRFLLLGGALVLAAITVAVLVVATGPRATSAPTSGPVPSTTVPPPRLKPVLGGLLDRHKLPPEQFQGAVAGYVVSVGWADLQPTAGGPLAAANPIDQAIASARARQLQLKLRVLAGTSAPDWAKRLGGDPVRVVDAYGHSGTVGRFWTAAFGQAYLDLQQRLAARYDRVPEIAETQITRCTTFFAEPFLRQGRNPSTIRNLVRAGYTAAADEDCQREQVDAHAVWSRTRSGLSFNPYQRVEGGQVKHDEAFTEQMMRYCRSKLGAACVLENHSIRTTGQGRLYQQMYQAMRSLGGAVGFQTASPNRIGSLLGTLDWAISQHASSVELPVSYRTSSSPGSLRPRNQRLQAIARSLA